LRLKPTEKAKLIDSLISRLHKSHKEIAELWAKDMEDRMDAYDQGKLNAISSEKYCKNIGRPKGEDKLSRDRTNGIA
jgi:hypothetical protein